jgi:hypothetical protein
MTYSAKQHCAIQIAVVPIIKVSEKPTYSHIFGKKADLYDLVIIARRAPHVPISNTTVKPLSADGTMSQGMGEYVVARSYKSAFLFLA